jgi:5-methylcytosine-specific restriction protein A
MVCTGFHEVRGPDIDGNDRKAIVFELTPISGIDVGPAPNDATEDEMWRQPIQLLRDRAIAYSNVGRSPSERRSIVRYRSDAIRVYVLRRANGVCEACDTDALFRTGGGRPYLEPHHIRRLPDGGPDHPGRIAAVCPNCHRRAHYGEDKGEFNKQLTRAIDEKERRLSS